MDSPDLSFRLRALPAAVFVDLLREARQPLNARALKQRLEERGIERDAVDAAWRRAQPGVKRHANVTVDAGGVYAWSDTPVPVVTPTLTPAEALERILRGRLPAPVKADLADLVRAALGEREALQRRARVADSGTGAPAATERQIRVDAARALAEVAMEAEELAAAGTAADIMVDRIRALAKAFDLAPIGRAGDETTFDPARHAPVGAYPPDGAAVVVIRPGYAWRGGGREVLVGRAQVAPVA